MNKFKGKGLLLIVLLFLASVICAGCGETVAGANKDAHRVGKGIKTIFVAEE